MNNIKGLNTLSIHVSQRHEKYQVKESQSYKSLNFKDFKYFSRLEYYIF